MRTVARNQDEVAEWFCQGRTFGRSQTGNLRIEGDILWHYKTVEAFRDAWGRIVRNANCYSRGFAYCPSFPLYIKPYYIHLNAFYWLFDIHYYAVNSETLRRICINEGKTSDDEATYTFDGHTIQESWDNELHGWLVFLDGEPKCYVWGGDSPVISYKRYVEKIRRRKKAKEA
ncbi:MAG: hypothetical protein ACTSV7_00085, partial [Candidatus Baldrarchaeia archaeon]